MTGEKAGETIIVPCERCGANVAATVEGSYDAYADEPGFAVRHVLLRCPQCDSPALAFQDDEDARYGPAGDVGERWGPATLLYPDTRSAQLGWSVPEPIRKAYAEARSCFAHAKAYTACAIVCRKLLEGICETHGARGSGLAAKLKDLSERGELDKRLFEWVTAVRLVGNEAAHDVNVTVSMEDARDLLDLAEAVAEYLYTFKEKFEAFQKRRKPQ